MLRTRTPQYGPGKPGPSLSIHDSVTGYAIYEAPTRLMRSKATEHAMRLVGIALILAGYVQWFLPSSPAHATSLQMGLLLMAISVGAGVSLYFFASRGFRRVVHIDIGQREIMLARVNCRDRSAISQKIAFDDVESLFVKRGMQGQARAILSLRVRNAPQDLPVLEGAQCELEALHARLCRDVRASLDVAPRRVKRFKSVRAGATTPRPNHRKAA